MQLYDTLVTMGEDLTELHFAPALLTWVLSTGAVMTTLMPAVQASIIFMLRKVCLRHGLMDYDRYQRTLSQFLWTGESDEARYSTLWLKLNLSVQDGNSRYSY